MQRARYASIYAANLCTSQGPLTRPRKFRAGSERQIKSAELLKVNAEFLHAKYYLPKVPVSQSGKTRYFVRWFHVKLQFWRFRFGA